MASKHLKNALTAVDWNFNAKTFLADDELVERVATANLRIAVWAKQLEAADAGNAALSFIREMQAAGHLVAACLALALYKAAAGSIRGMLENALYYTFFRSHPKELITLTRNAKYFVDKNEILDFHRTHTAGFIEAQQQLSLIGDVESWYSHVSSIVHGQVPGVWHNQIDLAKTAHSKEVLATAVELFCRGELLAHRLFLCTVSQELWDYFSQTAKTQLLAGLDGKFKALLNIENQ